jgi:hypothetical protein
MFDCAKCGTSFTRLDNLRRHESGLACKRKHVGDKEESKRKRNDVEDFSLPSTLTDGASTSNSSYCTFCNISIPKNRMNAHSRTLLHRTNSASNVRDGVKLVQSAFKNRICSYRVSSSATHNDFKLFFRDIKSDVLNVLEEMLNIHHTLKANIEVFASYYLETKETSDIKSFNTRFVVVDQGCDLSETYEEKVAAIITQITEFDEKDSGKLLT